MVTNHITCGNCAGVGKYTIWEVGEERDENGYQTAEAKETTCSQCGGKGYIESAHFTLEEAKTILKHCGLEVEI